MDADIEDSEEDQLPVHLRSKAAFVEAVRTAMGSFGNVPHVCGANSSGGKISTSSTPTTRKKREPKNGTVRYDRKVKASAFTGMESQDESEVRVR